MKRGDRSRLLALPDELLECILSTVTHPTDRCNVALVCSHLRRISRRTPHSLLVHFKPHHHRHSNVEDWSGELDVQSRAFPRVTSLKVRVATTLQDSLLADIGATCGQLKELRLFAVDWGRFEATDSGWKSLARQCPSKPLSAVLRLSSRKLQTLTLAGLLSFRSGMLAGCSSLESLTLERAEGSLEGLLAMLVRVDEAEGGAESPYGADAGASAAAEGSGGRRRRSFVDICAAAAATHADAASSWKDVRALRALAAGSARYAQSEAERAHEYEAVSLTYALFAVTKAIAACKAVSDGTCDARAEAEKARAMARLAAVAAGASGLFTGEEDEEEDDGEVGDAALFTYEQYCALATPNAVQNGVEESEAVDSVPISPREELLAELNTRSEQLRVRLSAMHETAKTLLMRENLGDPAEGPPAAAVEAAAVQEEGVQAEGRLGESCNSSAVAKACQGYEKATPVEVICPCLASLVLKNIQFIPAFDPACLPGYLPSTSPPLV
ncbi:unnamed protein product [Closterium sp. Yama58-4]|nr:unnamed protein product [Closterium sp. Yama58-4]